MEAMNSANGAVGSKEVDFYAFVPLGCEIRGRRAVMRGGWVGILAEERETMVVVGWIDGLVFCFHAGMV